ncbi:Tn3 family transposase [Actinomadura terrae]|uniref:Tn3 family transposase n=1 Tax=Actinomadura terrae TaxID=604353 RepID=UPI003555DC44
MPWWRPFGPLSGSDPKLRNPRARYSLVTFTYGTNMGPYQMARHLRGQVSAHETRCRATSTSPRRTW